MDHAAVINRCDEHARRLGLASLNAAERTVALASRAHFEVERGGLSAFFYNAAGDDAEETVLALEAVGARHAASALRDAMARFPGGSPPANRALRYPAWRQVSQSLGALDPAFGQDEPDLFSLLCSFIEAHQCELCEHR